MNLFSAIRLAAVLPAIDILEELLRKMRPQVLIVGEYLLNFHPGANHEIERYLEKNGFEIIEARMTDVIRKTYFCRDEQIRTYHLKKGIDKKSGIMWQTRYLRWPTQLQIRSQKNMNLYPGQQTAGTCREKRTHYPPYI